MNHVLHLPWPTSRLVTLAALHVIERAMEFNAEPMPLTVEEIGMGGSAALEAPEPGDVDTVVVARARPGTSGEWRSFRRLLDETFLQVTRFLDGTRLIQGRATIEALLALYREELEDLGFRPGWLDHWMPWVRVSDYNWARSIGVPVVPIDEKTLARRFLAHGWKRRPRLEIHLAGDYADPGEDIPALTIWTRETGPRTPTPEEAESFLAETYERVRNMSLRLAEGRIADLPYAYQVIANALHSQAKPRDPELARLHARTIQALHATINKLAALTTTRPHTPEDLRTHAITARSLQKKAIAQALLAETLADAAATTRARPGETPLEAAIRVYLQRARRRYGLARDARRTLHELLQTPPINSRQPDSRRQHRIH